MNNMEHKYYTADYSFVDGFYNLQPEIARELLDKQIEAELCLADLDLSGCIDAFRA